MTTGCVCSLVKHIVGVRLFNFEWDIGLFDCQLYSTLIQYMYINKTDLHQETPNDIRDMY